jgi:hypothetical protein
MSVKILFLNIIVLQDIDAVHWSQAKGLIMEIPNDRELDSAVHLGNAPRLPLSVEAKTYTCLLSNIIVLLNV